MLRLAGSLVTHVRPVIRIALGMNILVNERSGRVERRIMLLLLLHTGHGSATRLHDVRPIVGVPHALRRHIDCV